MRKVRAKGEVPNHPAFWQNDAEKIAQAVDMARLM